MIRNSRSLLRFPESQIRSPVETCGYQRLPTWSACESNSAAYLSKEQALNLLEPCMWMHHNVFLSNPGRPIPVISLSTKWYIPISARLTSNPLWRDFSSRERGGCEVFHTPPTSQTGLGYDSTASVTRLLWVVAWFCSHHRAPEVMDAVWRSWVSTSSILPLLSQHLPDLEQQSLDVGSVLVGMGLCRREAKRDDKHSMPL